MGSTDSNCFNTDSCICRKPKPRESTDLDPLAKPTPENPPRSSTESQPRPLYPIRPIKLSRKFLMVNQYLLKKYPMRRNPTPAVN